MKRRKRDLVARFRVRHGRQFRLAHIDPRDTAGIEEKAESRARFERASERLAELQERLYAQDRWAALIIFQGMDASGKDGAIRRVFTGVNPSGCQVSAFRAPAGEELEHDFLWRAARALPERGRIGVFNRSYYEEVVTVRIHPEFLEKQKLAEELRGADLWKNRFEDIAAYERYLGRNGVLIRKFFLHVSKAEQKRRFLTRIEDAEKNWKFRYDDVLERRHWTAYQKFWDEALSRTSTELAPWIVVPADHKWFTRLVVAEAVVEALEELDPVLPKLDAARRNELRAARRELEAENAATAQTVSKSENATKDRPR